MKIKDEHRNWIVMKTLSLISVLALTLTACSQSEISASAEEAQITPATAPASITVTDNKLTVAELYTSQGCSSCPPAEKLFSTLADQESLLTLEWHVDYWDDLVHGGSRWEDVYSDKKFTARQRAYNRNLRGTSAVYTPQAIINGTLEGVGSRPAEVSNMLENASELSVNLEVKNGAVTVEAHGQQADILFVRLLGEHVTNVKGGENKGRVLAGKNIVLEAKVLGKTSDRPVRFTLPAIGEGESCAVLVQEIGNKIGPILGAARC